MRRELKKGKGLVAVIMAAVMVVGLSACGGNTASNSGKNDASKEKKVYKVGVTQFADHPSLDNCRKGFIQGLEKGGFKEGDNLEVEFKSAQADMAMATQISQNFASNGKDLVCGIATPSAQSLYATCFEKNIPVIFNAVSDPIAAKLAQSETQPMKGVSGVSDELPVEAQLKLIREVLPDGKKIGIIYTTSEANSVSTLKKYKDLAPKYGFEIVEKGIAKQAEITQALDFVLSQVDCISNMTDNTVVAALGVMLEKANQKKIPVFGSEEEQVANGCVASAGLDYVALGIQAGEMAAKVLKGADISAIPFEKLKDSKITINEATAQKLGIAFTEDLKSKAQKK